MIATLQTTLRIVLLAGLATLTGAAGDFEARMRWTPETGAWPAVWMYEAPYVIGTTQRGCELGIFEGQGREPTYFATSHGWTGSNDRMNEGNRVPVSVDVREYHTDGLLWTPETLRG